MSTLIYWHRNDLRLHDNPALLAAARQATRLVPVYCLDPARHQPTRWGFATMSGQRERFLRETLADLLQAYAARQTNLFVIEGAPAEILPRLARGLRASAIVCEAIAAPNEEAEVLALRAAGMEVQTIWQSTLVGLDQLPYAPSALPDVFTAFRHRLERNDIRPLPPLAAPTSLPPGIATLAIPGVPEHGALSVVPPDTVGPSAPHDSMFTGGERAALDHVSRYFASDLPQTYKATRDALAGFDNSSKLSPWLALGALSPRYVYAALRQHETRYGANQSTYWLWFELLWRDYFRWLHLKYGARLYRARGLSDHALGLHDAASFERWCLASTGVELVDAGMRELSATGYVSNRMRQILASFLSQKLGCDWRAGAAWFEHHLIDYDVYSNQGNWAYIAGRGTDPRGGRWFDIDKQQRRYDANGAYRMTWLPQ